mmetsp:Transcript_50911/g.118622  ORF Transcript_50911/g.118622 Transcript_50911/m.118622 type:complete len:214 (-) Transcript_50911:6557-7198(-)
MPSLNDVVQEVDQPRFHAILLVRRVAFGTNPKARSAGGVRGHIHVASNAAPFAGHIPEDQREVGLLKVKAMLKGAHAHLLTHPISEVLHLIGDTVIQLVDLNDCPQDFEVNRTRSGFPSRNLREGPVLLDTLPQPLLPSDGSGMGILSVITSQLLVTVVIWEEIFHLSVTHQLSLPLCLNSRDVLQERSALFLKPDFLDPGPELLKSLCCLLV